MIVNYRSQDNRLSTQIEADTQRDIFEGLAAFQEVFEHSSCARCNGKSIRFVVRTDNEENKYYELHCQNGKCRAKKSFGCHKKGGGLFPHRKDETGNYLKYDGWLRWNPETKQAE